MKIQPWFFILMLINIVFFSCASTDSIQYQDYPEPGIERPNVQIINANKCYANINRIELATDSKDAAQGINIDILAFDIKKNEWVLFSNIIIDRGSWGFDVSSKMNARNYKYFALDFKNNKKYDLSISEYDRELKIYISDKRNSNAEINYWISDRVSKLPIAKQYNIIKKTLFDKLDGKEILIWKQKTTLINLDLDHSYKLSDIIIEPTPNYETKITYIFNNDKEEISQTYKIRRYISGTFVSKTLELASDFIIERKNTDDIIDEAKSDYLLVKNENLRIVYENKIAKREEQIANERIYRQLLREYGATEILSFSTLIDFRNAEMIKRFLFSDRNNIYPDTVIYINAYDARYISVFGGTKKNVFILEQEYTAIIGDNSLGADIIQLVVQDTLGAIKYKNTLIYPNVNGSDMQVNIYSIQGPVLIKCIGRTNITLTNGRMVARSLFQTIPFADIDPRKPKK